MWPIHFLWHSVKYLSLCYIDESQYWQRFGSRKETEVQIFCFILWCTTSECEVWKKKNVGQGIGFMHRLLIGFKKILPKVKVYEQGLSGLNDWRGPPNITRQKSVRFTGRCSYDILIKLFFFLLKWNMHG